jgi:hypothetical protein
MPDNQSRPVATTPDIDFTLSIEQALELYASSGLPIARFLHKHKDDEDQVGASQ